MNLTLLPTNESYTSYLHNPTEGLLGRRSIACYKLLVTAYKVPSVVVSFKQSGHQLGWPERVTDEGRGSILF